MFYFCFIEVQTTVTTQDSLTNKQKKKHIHTTIILYLKNKNFFSVRRSR